MEGAAIPRTAALLGEARLAAQPVPDLAAVERPADTAEGYAVQKALSAYLSTRGYGAPVGWKIGATTADMQVYLGVDGPAYGRILSANRYAAGASLSRAAFCNPGIECEIGVRIGRDADTVVYDGESVGTLIASVFPAIEIVENRYGNFLERGTPTLIADDFFHKACIPGREIDAWQAIDLAAVSGQTVVDGEIRGTGTGAAVMSHPLEAVAWLANMLNTHGERLGAGQIVLTGSLAPVIWLEPQDRNAVIAIESLGEVSVDLA